MPRSAETSRPAVALRAAVCAAAVLVAAAMPARALAQGRGAFLRGWLVADPFETTDLDRPDLPDGFAPYPGLYAVDRVWFPARADPEGKLDFREMYPRQATGTAVAHTFFRVPADGTYILRIGSDDAVRVDVDGRTVHRKDVHRAWSADADEVEVRLAKGWHRVLARVVEYGGQWALSVRVADARNRPLELEHGPGVPDALADEVYPEGPVTREERALVVVHLAEGAVTVKEQLAAAQDRLAAVPEGYGTFPEYEGARRQGLAFFDALAVLWDAITGDRIDPETLEEAERAALGAAEALSPGLVPETRQLVSAMGEAGRVWERLGRGALSPRDLAEATLDMAELLFRSRRLAYEVEGEHVRMARLENDIRNYRQRDVTVRVVDAEGGPVRNARVEIVQDRHEFLFGCNLFAFGRWDERREETYEKRFARLFNLAVVPLFWSGLEGAGGRPDYGQVDRMLEWTEKRGIAARGHPLLWSRTVPRRIDEMKPDEARQAVEEHLRRTVNRYRTRIEWWDVLVGPDSRGRFGPAEVGAAEAFRWTAAEKPEGRLLVGGDDAAKLSRLGRGLREAEVPIDGVGLAAHQHAGAWPVELVRRRLDEAARSGLPVHVSAVTILGGPRDEARQAEAARRFYTAAFAHPKVASISWWDLSDRFAWKHAPAGLLREDLSPKPAYETLDRLINHLWRTDAAGQSDDDGRITVRAFHGSYRITAREGRRKKTVRAELGHRGPREVEVVLPAAK